MRVVRPLPLLLHACLLPPPPQVSSSSPAAAAQDLGALIAGLHGAGLEVLLSVEYCLTGEGGDAGAGRLQGLRGIDHNVYYRCAWMHACDGCVRACRHAGRLGAAAGSSPATWGTL